MSDAAYVEKAKEDRDRMARYKSTIQRVGRRYGIRPAVIAGIISRESRAGIALDNGWGDNGKAWGLMQVDVTPDGGRHTPRGHWDSEEHLCQGTEILVDFIRIIGKKFPGWSQDMRLKGGLAAYNKGDGNVHDEHVDRHTMGGDYSKDVLARAGYYSSQGY